MKRRQNTQDLLPGGRGDWLADSNFDAKALRRGTRHELEHTDDPRIAKEIAKDHLAEDPKYYEKLARMEKAENRPRVERRRNPGDNFSRAVIKHYNEFHGVEPDTYEMAELWVPGALTLLGHCVEVNYQIIDPESKKDVHQVYFHEHGPKTQVYERCEKGSGDLRYSTFPKDLIVLGSFPGLIVQTEDGEKWEIEGSTRKFVAVPDRRRLVVLDDRGVLFLIRGGDLRIDDWIYH